MKFMVEYNHTIKLKNSQAVCSLAQKSFISYVCHAGLVKNSHYSQYKTYIEWL